MLNRRSGRSSDAAIDDGSAVQLTLGLSSVNDGIHVGPQRWRRRDA
jgi:hypothetical protein